MLANASLAPILLPRLARRSEDPATPTSRSRPGFAGRETRAVAVPRPIRLREDRGFAPQTRDSRPGRCVCPTHPASGTRPAGRRADRSVFLARAVPDTPSDPPSPLSPPLVPRQGGSCVPRRPRPPAPRCHAGRRTTPDQRGAEGGRGPGGGSKARARRGVRRGAAGVGSEAGTPLALA